MADQRDYLHDRGTDRLLKDIAEAEVEIVCAACGRRFCTRESIANAEAAPCCSEECEGDLAAERPGHWRDEDHDHDYGGVLGADGQVHSDADPGL